VKDIRLDCLSFCEVYNLFVYLFCVPIKVILKMQKKLRFTNGVFQITQSGI